MEVSKLYDSRIDSPTISYRDIKLLRILRKIEAKGHCLTQNEMEYARVTVTSIGLVRSYYFYGKNAYRDYVLSYNLDPFNAFTGQDLPVKNGFIKLIFNDGSVVVRKEFLLKYFTYFKFKFDNIPDKKVNIFRIEDFSSSHFIVILKYYYAQIIVITLDMIVELYRLADFFVVDYAFMRRITVYINCFYSKIAKTIGFYRYHKYFEEDYLGGDNTGLQVNSEEEDDDIDRLYYLYQHKCNNAIEYEFMDDDENEDENEDEEDEDEDEKEDFDNESIDDNNSMDEDANESEDMDDDDDGNMDEEMDENMNEDMKSNVEMGESQNLVNDINHGFERFKCKVAARKRVEDYIDKIKKNPSERIKDIRDILINENEIFIYNEDSIEPKICHLKLLNTEIASFERFEYSVRPNTKHAFVSYMNGFLILRNSLLTTENVVNNTIFCEIFSSFDSSNTKLILDIHNEIKLDFNIEERIFNDYFIFQHDNYIYLILNCQKRKNECSFFRCDINTGVKEELISPEEVTNFYNVCFYKSKLYFLLKPLQNISSNDSLIKFRKDEKFEDNAQFINSYCFDPIEISWNSFQQPLFNEDNINTCLQVIDDDMYYFKAPIACQDLTMQDSILRYDVSQNSSWIRIK